MFRGGIRDRSQILCICALIGIEAAGNPKVDQLHLVVGRYHDIAGLQIAQDNWRVARVDVAQCLAHLHHPPDDLLFRQRAFAIFQNLLQAATGDKFHHKVVVAALLEWQHQRGNAWMLQTPQERNFLVEAVNSGFTILFAGIWADQQFFHSIIIWRYARGSPYLFDFVDGTHPTLAKNLHHFKLTIKNCSYWESHTPVFSKCA